MNQTMTLNILNTTTVTLAVTITSTTLHIKDLADMVLNLKTKHCIIEEEDTFGFL